MTPYYEDDAVTIFHGDCREILPTLEADVLVTDPPYGMGHEAAHRGKRRQPIHGDDDLTLRDEILHYWGDRPALVFGTWRKPRPTATRELLVWHKTGVGFLGDLSLPWGPSHEEIYVLGNGWEGKRRSNVYAVDGLSAGSSKRPDHPTPKPVPLLQALISYCPPGVIVDPFMGAGSTLRAAKDLGRTAIGIELEERYCEAAATRLGQEVLSL
jgi:site-specific DNA-methyltransferase (adenine-specific)|tara:strand:- start:49 stop:684 length:636 start_codon:yes stop_codon:yes gene_type:complete